MKKKKILIVGIHDFIGKQVAESAYEAGLEIFGLSDKRSTTIDAKPHPLSLLKGSFEEEEILRSELKENHFEYIVYALRTNSSHLNSQQLHLINATSPLKMLKILNEENRIPNKFVFISSLSAFGPADRQATGILENNSYPHPLSEFGKSMLQAEKFVENFKHVPYLILRPGFVYGDGNPWIETYRKLLAKGISVKPPKKEQLLSGVHVKDLASLILKSFEVKISRQAFFVTDREIYKVETILDLLREPYKHKAFKEINPYESKISNIWFKILLKYHKINIDLPNKIPMDCLAESWNVDSSNLKIYYDFEPEYSLEQGMK